MAAAVAVRVRTEGGVSSLGPRRLNGSVALQQAPPAKRPRLEHLDKEKALELRKKHIAYVTSTCMFTRILHVQTAYRSPLVVCTQSPVFALPFQLPVCRPQLKEWNTVYHSCTL